MAGMQAARIIRNLIVCAHSAGAAAHDLAALVYEVATQVGVDARLLETPDAYLLSITTSTGDNTTEWIAMGPVRPNIAMLVRLNQALALRNIDALIETSRQVYVVQRWRALLAACIAMAFARILGETWLTAGGAGTIALFFFLLTAGSGGVSRLLHHLFLPSFLVAAFAAWLGVPLYAFVISTLICHVPGFGLTTALMEMTAGHSVIGFARATKALLVIGEIAAGAALGAKVMMLLGVQTTLIAPALMPSVLEYFGLGALAGLALAVLFGATRGLAVSSAAIGVAAGVVQMSLSYVVDLPLASLVAAFFLSAVAHLASWFRHQPPSVMIVPGLLLLAPGALGVEAFTAWLLHPSQYPVGLIEMGLVTLCLALGVAGGARLARTKRVGNMARMADHVPATPLRGSATFKNDMRFEAHT